MTETNKHIAHLQAQVTKATTELQDWRIRYPNENYRKAYRMGSKRASELILTESELLFTLNTTDYRTGVTSDQIKISIGRENFSYKSEPVFKLTDEDHNVYMLKYATVSVISDLITALGSFQA